MSQKFGTVLKLLRKELHISQIDLAETLTSTQRHISFLETGKTVPTRAMLSRLTTQLSLNAGQRASLFDASGFRNPFKRRDFSSEEVSNALDLMEQRLLAHWPFPAWVMDSQWTILRMNRSAKVFFTPFMDIETGHLNVFSLFLSDEFRSMVENWSEASLSLYFRLQSASAHSAKLRQEFQTALDKGIFDHITNGMMQTNEIPIYIPTILKLPNGAQLHITSLLGQLVSIHDALVEGFDVEMMMPTNAASEILLKEICSED